MADVNAGENFTNAFRSSEYNTYLQRNQAEAERAQQYSENEARIKQTLQWAADTVKAATEAGKDPASISKVIMPVVESAAKLAAGPGGQDQANYQRVIQMGNALLARPAVPQDNSGNFVAVPTSRDPYSGEITSRILNKKTGQYVDQPAAPTQPKPTPMNLGPVTGISIDGQPTQTPPNERVAQGFEDAGAIPSAAAPVQSTANAKAADIPIADPKVQNAIDRGLIGKDSLDFRAELWLLDQNSAKGIARGKEGAAITNAVISRGTEIAKARGIAPGEINAQTALTGSSRKALDQIIKQQNALEAFEKTAEKNGDAMVALAKQVDSTGIPVLESITRRGKQALGDPTVAAFFTQYELYKAEVAKILTQSNMQGVLTDTARKEIESAIQPNASYKQLVKVHELLKADFGRRNEANQEQVDKIMNSFSQRGRSSQPAAAPQRGPDELQRIKEKYGLK